MVRKGEIACYNIIFLNLLLVTKTWLLQGHFDVCVCLCLSGFVQTVTSISMDAFQNNLAQLFSVMSKFAT